MALVIYDKEFKAYTDRMLDAFLKTATLELHTISRDMASRPNTGVTVKIQRPRKGGATTQRTIYPNSSKPGESPKRRTGVGHKSIVQGYSPQRQEGRVGYTRLGRHMTFHELGIKYSRVGLQQRPTIVPAWKRNQPRIFGVARNAALRVR